MDSAFDLLLALISAVTLFGAVIIPLYTVYQAYFERTNRIKWLSVLLIECILASFWFFLPDETAVSSFRVLYIFMIEIIAIGVMLLVPQNSTAKTGSPPQGSSPWR